MQSRVRRIVTVGVSIVLGLVASLFLFSEENSISRWIFQVSWLKRNAIFLYIIFTIIFGIIFYFLIYVLHRHFYVFLKTVAKRISELPTNKILAGTTGILIGLILAFLLSQLYVLIPIQLIAVILAGLTYIALVYLGAYIAVNRFSEFGLFTKTGAKGSDTGLQQFTAKVIDTSAIIDGRFTEICKTGFIEGDLYISEFVLKELRHIADSDDDLTRTKGRRGLDSIKELQNNEKVQVIITGKDYPKIDEVDLKLLSLAKELGASVVTTDYNLNKVAILQEIKVLNVNDLSNAVKPNAVAGEIFDVEIIKEGKGDRQGVGYLSDGTMIVVEDADKKIGKTLTVEVTSVLQTPAGRMIFAKIRS